MSHKSTRDILDKILLTYSEDISKSSTLISIVNCKADGITKSINERLISNEFLEYYLKLCIDNEIRLSTDYHIFYTAQSFGKYVSSRLLDFLITKSDVIPSYYLYKGIPQRVATNYTVGGKYSDMKEYMRFINNFFINEMEKPIEISDSVKESLAAIFQVNKDIIDKSYIEENREMINIMLEGYADVLLGTGFIPVESFDKQGSELGKNMYSLNNTALGNSFGNQSQGESTFSFLLSKYLETFNVDNLVKYLKLDIKNMVTIDHDVLDHILLDFSKEIKTFYDTYIGNDGSTYKTKNGVVFQIAIKKDYIYKYVLPSVGYGIPLITKIKGINYERDFKPLINNYFAQTRTYPTNEEKIKESVENLLSRNHPKISDYIKKELHNTCDYITDIQSRAIITDEWKQSLLENNGDIKINVFPCNYDDRKDECKDFVREVDTIIKTTVDKIKAASKYIEKKYIVNSYKNKYLKYKAKYINLKNKLNE